MDIQSKVVLLNDPVIFEIKAAPARQYPARYPYSSRF